MIEKNNQGVYKNFVCYIGMGNSTLTLEKRMEYLAVLDMSLNKSQPGSSPNTTTTTKASARKMNSKQGGTTCTVGPAKDDRLTCYNCGQVDHISRNRPNGDLMKKLLEQSLVGKDFPKAKSGRPPEHKKRGGALTGRQDSEWLAKIKEAKQQTNSDAERECKSLSDSDTEVGQGKGDQ
jgi:hypothetical protein